MRPNHKTIVIMLVAFMLPGLQATAGGNYDGKYVGGAGDAAALQRIDQSFQFFHANPDVPNLSMLYRSDWNAFAEGSGWQGWWIQNSYGFSYAATPFLQPYYRATLQNSLDMFWNNQGDGLRKGKFGEPGSPGYELVAPDGALGDCATPDSIVYKQGDGNLDRHDWFYEATAAGVVMQSEILLTSRDRQAIAHYLPKMERACDHIETTRDTSNNLFLVGPASNLLAPSFGGIMQADGTFGKAYLTGLSVNYLAAVDRMVELYKLTGDAVKQAEYQHRADITRASLSKLTTSGAQGKYFVKSVEKTGTGLGTKHGVLGQSRFGYLEGVANADAVGLRVADDAMAKSIYNTIAATPGIRPHDFLLTNSSGLDDTYWNYGSTDVGTSYMQFGDWVNGGAWGTVEGRAILAYARLGKFSDITLSAERALKWAKDFRMDAPFTQGGENTSNYWCDPGGPMGASQIAVMIDNFAIPTATLRGMFDYEYRWDRLVLRPRVPGEITKYVQKEPVYFGDKKIYLTCTNGGPNVVSVTVNGAAIDADSSAQVDLLYDSLPNQARVHIVTAGGWPKSKLPQNTVASFTTAMPAPLSTELQTPYEAVSILSRLLAEQPEADYERSFVEETLSAIRAWQVNCSMDRGAGINRSMTPEKVKSINKLYHATALNMYNGLASHMAESSLSPLWNKAIAQTATTGQAVANTKAGKINLGVIMPLGDSITMGYPVAGGYRGPLHARMFPEYTFSFVGSSTENSSATLTEDNYSRHEGHGGYFIRGDLNPPPIVNGNTVSGLYENLKKWIGPGKAAPNIILLMVGTNDIYHDYQRATAPGRLTALINRIYYYQPNVSLFVASITPMQDTAKDANAQTYNAAIPDIVRNQQKLGRDVRLVDIYGAISTSDLYSDGVHVDSSGYEKMAQAWYDTVKTLVTKSKD